MSSFLLRSSMLELTALSIAARISLSVQFTSGGINQTRHQIIMEINATVNVILPTETVTSKVKSDFVIAETVIIGKVPESFTNVEDSSRPINEKLIDFSLNE